MPGNLYRVLVALFLIGILCGIAQSRAVAEEHGLSDSIRIQRTGNRLQVSNSAVRLDYDLFYSRMDLHWNDGASLRGAYCAARIAREEELRSSQYGSECDDKDIQRCQDAFGTGVQITIHHRSGTRPELRQHIWIYRDLPYVFVSLDLIHTAEIASNHIAPLVIGSSTTPDAGLELKVGNLLQILYIPFDNDQFVRYNSHNWNQDAISYEATAIYDNESRHGFVIGSVTHDLWKTGIAIHNVEKQSIGGMRVYGGAAGNGTHDTRRHGMVQGKVVSSPRLFIGYFPDYRDGLEAYGRANARITPPLRWTGGVPVGWNSWAAYMDTVHVDQYIAASDFLKGTLQPGGFGGRNDIYVNLDSYWDNLSEMQLRQAVAHAHANGQKAGIYWTPFTAWGDDFDRFVEGSGERYRYREILLKDASGHPLPKLDNGWPLDPTHPGTLQRIDWQMRRFVAWGFDFVKLDFLSHGALEGAHFDPAIPTGIAAYNMGMKRIREDLNPAKIGRPFFISLSIAPLFPNGYGHSRRISCDAFASLDQTEYLLNALTYGWWANDTLYRYNDPDHTVVYKVHGQSPVTEAEGRSRYNASVIAGTVLLNSDDLTDPQARARVQALFTNPELNALALRGQAFRPVEGDTGDRAASLFLMNDAKNHATYLALFNYDAKVPVTRQVALERLGLSRTARYHVRDLWTGHVTHTAGTLTVDLAPAASTILQLMPD